MRRIGFAINPTSPRADELRGPLTDWARTRGITAWEREARDLPGLVADLPGSDLLVVLGGDGTFLRAARAVAEVDVPILGVNAGKVGFLSKADPAQALEVLERMTAGRFSLEPRMLLEATVLPGGDPGLARTYVGLNDAAIVRGAQARVVHLDVAISGSHMATWTCDGLVVATPTGSTAYSFSAGGPILEPTSRNLVLTPIAGYLSAIRSVVVGEAHIVHVRILETPGCLVSIDGHEDVPLVAGDEVRIVVRPRPIRLVEPEGAAPFWDLLRRKAALLPS